ncbi:MAG: SDR family oxidoreductase [Nocardioidaceae bacterium]
MATHVVTSAGSGIGLAIAQRLSNRGDELLLLARDRNGGAELASRIHGARALVADLADPAGISAALAAQYLPDRLDSVLHVAGVVDLGSVFESGVNLWREIVDVNLLAPAELTRLLLPALRSGRGQVVFVNSSAVLSVTAGRSAYAASKHGLRALADSLRVEAHEHGVRVTSVYPGRTATPMQQKVLAQEGKEFRTARWIDPESVATTVLTALDLPRDAEITDLTVRHGV